MSACACHILLQAMIPSIQGPPAASSPYLESHRTWPIFCQLFWGQPPLGASLLLGWMWTEWGSEPEKRLRNHRYKSHHSLEQVHSRRLRDSSDLLRNEQIFLTRTFSQLVCKTATMYWDQKALEIKMIQFYDIGRIKGLNFLFFFFFLGREKR